MMLRRAQRDRQRERGFPATDIAAQNRQIAASKSTTDAAIETGKATRDRISVLRALSDRVDLSE